MWWRSAFANSAMLTLGLEHIFVWICAWLLLGSHGAEQASICDDSFFACELLECRTTNITCFGDWIDRVVVIAARCISTAESLVGERIVVVGKSADYYILEDIL